MPVESVPVKMVIFILYIPRSKLTPHIHQMIQQLHFKYMSHNYQNTGVISNVTNLFQQYLFFWWMHCNCTDGGEERCVQGVGGETWGKETTRKIHT
jgi:hypothetical protein